ncbi:hypothetical protein ACFVUS_25595 [Nocardia sp. NPDC058058]|uniref:hypothetical protein n=1 Tax=Nocardia sp. NPDC058058 TaxID=3346317 RepID=UPI0036DE9337
MHGKRFPRHLIAVLGFSSGKDIVLALLAAIQDADDDLPDAAAAYCIFGGYLEEKGNECIAPTIGSSPGTRTPAMLAVGLSSASLLSERLRLAARLAEYACRGYGASDPYVGGFCHLAWIS